MAQFQYGYIIKAPGYTRESQTATLESPEFKSNIVGVGSVEEACDAARALVEKQVTLIELCSGFKENDAKAIFDAVEGAAKIGYIGGFFVKE
ncbi:MAG: DUF6506 family protein [Desulfobacterales bacterium]|nr:DUF6506 family protein [Desulfobacterales bacterium]